jgi:hypothetical protein
MSESQKDVVVVSLVMGVILGFFLLVSPVSAFYFQHDPNDPAENAPFKEGLFPLIQKIRAITCGKPRVTTSWKAGKQAP